MANDPEIVVGTGKMLGVFVTLVVVCALFFGFGYSVGRGAAVSASVKAPPAIVVTGQRGAPHVASAEPASNVGTAPAVSAETTTPADTTGSYFLQIAAVTRQEDAEALVSALRKKQYAVFAVNNVPSDRLFHVQIGPFGNPKDAETLRAKLVGDGYNPIVKKQG